MSLANHIVVFFISWWLVFFMVLPWGVTGLHESDQNYQEGMDPGAPVKANMARKLMITTAIAIIVWAVFWLMTVFDLISISR